jgi:DNA-binding response OmpR family regulator
VLEDDASVRELLALSLGARGARVRLAATLDDLEASLAVSSCDVLLTDLSPLDGAEASQPRTTLDALAERARARNPKAVVLAISGSASAAAGTGVRWLRKPFSTEELVAAILDARGEST